MTGRVKQISIGSVLSLLELEVKNGELTVRHEGERAHFFLRDGKIAKAWFDEEEKPRGEECVYRVMTWQDGDFIFRSGKYTGEIEMDFPMSKLLLEFARRTDVGELG